MIRGRKGQIIDLFQDSSPSVVVEEIPEFEAPGTSIQWAGTGPCGREKPPGTPGAAVHRHILDRMNAINDSFKKKKHLDPNWRQR